MKLRKPRPDERDQINTMIMRSKAHWGYDAAFLEACRDELGISEKELGGSNIKVLDKSGLPVGIVTLLEEEEQLHLSKLFVDPSMIGSGAGRILFEWASKQARTLGWNRMMIDSDPGASAFYQHMGAEIVGYVPSGSIAGRFLPHLQMDLKNQKINRNRVPQPWIPFCS